MPFPLDDNAPLDIDLLVDRSVIDFFVTSRICIVQRVYPTRHDSTHVKLFTHDHPIHVKNLTKYQMDATNPW